MESRRGGGTTIPGLDDVIREETLRVLEDILRAGKARHVGIAGTLPACIAGVSQPRPFTLAQFADPPGAEALAQVQAAAGRPIATITHSVFGVDGEPWPPTGPGSASPGPGR